MYAYSETELRTIAIIPMFTGCLSIVGSVTIIFMILRSEKKLSTSYRRLIFGMSSMDIIYSLALSMTTFASPSGTEGVWKPLGNNTTCTIQGLAVYFGGTGTTMYNCALSIFYVLTIAKGVSRDAMSKKIEPFLHAVPLTFVVLSSIFLLSTQSFNTNGQICMISPYPRKCDLDDSIDCTRGARADSYYRYFQGYPIIFNFLVIVISMIYLYTAVVVQERRMNRYRTQQSTLPEGIQIIRRNSEAGSAPPTPRITPEARNRRAAMVQCSFYVAAYLMSWTPPSLYLAIDKSSKYIFAVNVFTVVLSPLQGLLNFIVYIRPQVKSVMEVNEGISLWKAFKITIKSRDLDIVSMRRRRSLMDTQSNGGRRYTAREWHLQKACEEVKLEDDGSDSSSDKGNGQTLFSELESTGRPEIVSVQPSGSSEDLELAPPTNNRRIDHDHGI